MATESITEDVVTPIGVPAAVNTIYQNTKSIYDIAIGGLPFYMAASNNYPYHRETASYKRQQLDLTQAPGEQTFEGWWLRSQGSWHLGAGINYLEPLQGADVIYRFNKSVGVDPWTPGQLTLLSDVTKVLATTGETNMMGAIDGSNNSCVFVSDGSALKRISDSGTVTTVTYGGSGSNIFAMAHDGTYYYVANATGIYRGDLTGGSGTLIFTHPSAVGTVTNVSMGWVKQRLIAGINNYIYEIVQSVTYNVAAMEINNKVATLYTTTQHNFRPGDFVSVASVSPNGAAFNNSTGTTGWGVTATAGNSLSYVHDHVDVYYTAATAGTVTLVANNNHFIYAHPNTNWKWTGVTEGPTGIYVAGYAGTASTIAKLSLDSNGAVPELSNVVTAADFPDDEHVTSVGTYLGKFVLIGTNKGIRVGLIDSSVYGGGFITYGPLTYTTGSTDHVTGFAFRDRFAYGTVTNAIDGKSGLIRIDLSQLLSDGKYAYATDLCSGTTGACNGIAFIGETGRAAFIVDGDGVYFQHATNKVASGYMDTGATRFNTIEKKHFKFVKVRTTAPLNGNIAVSTITKNGTVASITTLTSDAIADQDLTTNLSSAQEQLAFRFTLYRNATDSTLGAGVIGYQIKALPVNKRTRSISIPLMCYDFEMDRYNIETGYEGRAWERLSTLENLESEGNLVTIQDFTTGEQVDGWIEKITFDRVQSPERRFKGFGGIVYVQVRTT